MNPLFTDSLEDRTHLLLRLEKQLQALLEKKSADDKVDHEADGKVDSEVSSPTVFEKLESEGAILVNLTSEELGIKEDSEDNEKRQYNGGKC